MKFFQDDAGNFSSTRLMCLLLLLCTIFVILWGVIQDNTDMGLITILLGYVFGGKILSKHAEKKPDFNKPINKSEL